MAYRKITYTAGPYKAVEKSHTRRLKGGPRAKKEAETSEAVRAENHRRRIRLCQLLIMANFQPGDLFLDLTYEKSKRPEDIQEAKQIFREFMRKLKRKAKKAGLETKWIMTTEKGERGACHHHVIINDEPRIQRWITELWNKGVVHFQHIYDPGDGFMRLAEYMVKQAKAGEQVGVSYSRSRNLIVPQAKEEIVENTGTWRPDPKPEKGYVILKETIRNGVNQVTGYPWQRYVMVKAGR